MGTKLVKTLNMIVEIIAIAFVIAMLCVVCANVVMRYFFRSPITGHADANDLYDRLYGACANAGPASLDQSDHFKVQPRC